MTISIKALREAGDRGEYPTDKELEVLIALAEADLELSEAGSALESVPREHIGERIRATSRAIRAEEAVRELLAQVTR